LKKNDEIGMPNAIKDVVEMLAELRQSTPEEIESLVQANFVHLIANDPWLIESRATQFLTRPSSRFRE
jgi:hypothetical protein